MGPSTVAAPAAAILPLPRTKLTRALHPTTMAWMDKSIATAVEAWMGLSTAASFVRALIGPIIAATDA